MERKKILYIMHVPWGWIKQRPHFFAEYLSEEYTVDVIYKRPWKVKKKDLLNTNNENNLNIKSYLTLPFDRIKILKNISLLHFFNIFLIKIQLRNLKKYDYVWYTSLSGYSRFKKMFGNETKVLYDCMDDDFEFGNLSLQERSKLLKEEKEILLLAEVVFCSSNYLKNKILTRTQSNREISIVNNAIELPHKESFDILPSRIKEVVEKIETLSSVFMYIGTISEWFDFDSIIYVLEKNPSINFVLFGPKDVSIPNNKRIHYFGTIDREYIFLLMSQAMALIMPFKLNELIMSVNPVKLYEYIYAEKPVLSIKYEETLKFKGHVYLYQNKEELSEYCRKIIHEIDFKENKISKNKEFALENTWKRRIDIVLLKLKLI